MIVLGDDECLLVDVPGAYFCAIDLRVEPFSMARDTASGAKDLWVYFVVAIPVLASAFLIARPPNRGIL